MSKPCDTGNHSFSLVHTYEKVIDENILDDLLKRSSSTSAAAELISQSVKYVYSHSICIRCGMQVWPHSNNEKHIAENAHRAVKI